MFPRCCYSKQCSDKHVGTNPFAPVLVSPKDMLLGPESIGPHIFDTASYREAPLKKGCANEHSIRNPLPHRLRHQAGCLGQHERQRIMTTSLCLRFVTNEAEHQLSGCLGNARLSPLSISLLERSSFILVCEGSFYNRDVKLYHMFPDISFIF